MNKTIIIGLDGATWNNLLPWIKENKLLTFKKIIHKGVYAKNITTIPCTTSPAIPSFFTGTNPIKTKVFGFRKYDGSIISSKNMKGARFWDILGDYNLSSLIVNLRTTYPPNIKKGVLVSGLFAPSPESDFVCPSIEKKYFLNYVRSNSEIKKAKGRRALLNMLWKDEENRFKTFEKFRKLRKFDFELFYFGCTDTIQHRLWESQIYILETYKKINFLLKKFIKKNKNCNIILFSDHGFGASPKKIFYLNKWLEDNNCLVYKNTVFKYLNKIYSKIYYDVGWILEKHLTTELYDKIYSFLKNKNKKKRLSFCLNPPETELSYLDLQKTKAYLSQKWGINIIKKNVSNYCAFRKQLISKLKNIKDSQGKIIFEEIYPKEKIYKNSDKFEEIPDIIFILNQDYEPRSGYNKKILSKTLRPWRRVEGSHENQREGIFMAFGPDIKEGIKIADIQIYDIAPTILHMYGVPIPREMDGRVLKEIFKKGSNPARRRVRYEKLSEKIQIHKITEDVKI